MATLNISLPDRFSRFITEKVATGGYRDVNEYLITLIAADHEREFMQSERLEELRREVNLGLTELNGGDFAEYSSGEHLASDVKARGRAWLKEQGQAAAK